MLLCCIFSTFLAYSNDSLKTQKEDTVVRNQPLSVDKIEIKDYIDKRFDDLFWWFTVFIATIGGVFTLTYLSAQHTARKQASEEFDKYVDKVEALDKEARKIEPNINKLKSYLDFIKKLPPDDPDTTTDSKPGG